MKNEILISIADRRFAEAQLRRAVVRLRQSKNMKIKDQKETNILLALMITAIREYAESSGHDIASKEFFPAASNVLSTAYAIMRVDHDDGTRVIKGQP